MLWIIILLLVLIVLVLTGATGILSLIGMVFALGLVWVSSVFLGASTETASWMVGIVFGLAILHACLSDPQKKTCPFCDEEIKFKASLCKHCGQSQPPSEVTQIKPTDGSSRFETLKAFSPIFLVAGAIVGGLMAIVAFARFVS